MQPVRSCRFHPLCGFSRTLLSLACLGVVPGLGTAAEEDGRGAGGVAEVVIIGTTPVQGIGQAAGKVPFNVRLIDSEALRSSNSLDLSAHLASRTGSVSINSAQNNPLQPDLQFRGFTASPLLGLAQGISVYQNGVRINEPLGDTVNWDLLPKSAVSSLQLVGGADPVFGLNTLGGAIAIDMKDGFDFIDHQVSLGGGSWGRRTATVESGGNNGRWGYYVNVDHMEESGWRDLSPSEATSVYSSLGWRDGDVSAVNFNAQLAQSDLRGNGASPVGLLARKRDAIFTAPDITENDMTMLSVDGSHFLSEGLQLAGTVFWRENQSDSFNGDGSEFELCEYSGGAQSLFEEAEEAEEALADDLGIELDEVCEGGNPAITSYADLESYIEDRAMQFGYDPEDYEIEDATDDINGSGILSDEAINNISDRNQESQGFDFRLSSLADIGGLDNHLTVGVAWFRGDSDFNSIVELARLGPNRSTEGLGTGAFFSEAETHVTTRTETSSLYFRNALDLSDTVTLTLAGRYNDTDIRLRDTTGERPELNGDHSFQRFNPSLGLTWDVRPDANLYLSYSESNRVPTPIELACNEGVFEVARRYALEAGEDPDDIEFECRLPNAFLADPPLDDVVTRSVELGVRGMAAGLDYQLGLFNAVNRDDILFQTTGRATGLFANVDKTRRRGIEASLNGGMGPLQWYGHYTWLDASFEDDFEVLSPNHPDASEEGVISVRDGNTIPGLPEHNLKLGMDYQLMASLSAGIEVIYNAGQYLRGDESNALDELDGYTLVNLQAQYRIDEHLLLFARVSNLFDREYENFGLLGEEPDEVLTDLDDERPLFLGPGAPRGIWAGVRYRF